MARKKSGKAPETDDPEAEDELGWLREAHGDALDQNIKLTDENAELRRENTLLVEEVAQLRQVNDALRRSVETVQPSPTPSKGLSQRPASSLPVRQNASGNEPVEEAAQRRKIESNGQCLTGMAFDLASYQHGCHLSKLKVAVVTEGKKLRGRRHVGAAGMGIADGNSKELEITLLRSRVLLGDQIGQGNHAPCRSLNALAAIFI
jgi:hypothetical protein